MESGKIFATLYLSLFKFNTGKNYPEIKGDYDREVRTK